MEVGRGLLRVVPNDELVRQENSALQAQRDAEEAARQADVALSGLAAHIEPYWQDAKRAKDQIRPRMVQSLRQRRGEYDAEKLQRIRDTGGTDIFMMITSVKCRAAGSWLRDAMLGTGSGKPWTASSTPHPEMPDDSEQELYRAVGQEAGMIAAVTGQPVPPDLVRMRIDAALTALKGKLREKAREKAEETERVLEDQMVEGGFNDALDEFIDDFVTYPVAILKGPVIHNAPVLTWDKTPAEDGSPRWTPVVTDQLVKRWYRIDPFKFFPASWAADIEDGPCFEHHRITAAELHSLIGAPGYREDKIREVLKNSRAFQHWLGLDWYPSADEINQPNQWSAFEGPMDALECYIAVQGRVLMDEGIDDPAITDPEKPYNVNLWRIGPHIIKATVNPDPLGKKPYRKACYEEIPGAFYGNAIPDLVRDVQDMCNNAARSLANNMAIASGPQVGMNRERMPPGEEPTSMYPWKVWQFTSDPMGSTAPPLEFFSPSSHATELMNVFMFFSTLADEYSGLPKYMSGDGNVGGAGRTASGLSSLMSNANRLMKQVMSSIDRIIADSVTTLHQHLMQWEFDRFPELEGDVKINARGAASVLAREQLALRRNEFLQATGNPVDMQLIGPDGRAYLLREQAKLLEMDTDRLVPGTGAMPQMMGAPGQPGMGGMPGTPGQPGSAASNAPNQRPPGATMDRPALG